MHKYVVIFLMCVNVSLSDPSCCEEEILTKSYLDLATTMISKAKSIVPSCNETKKCEETKKCDEIKECDGDKINIDCADLYKRGYNKSGVYTIQPFNRLINNKSLNVYCDMETDGGGWIVIQRRGNYGSPNNYFFKDWASYKNGFGSNQKDFWIGNDNIFALSNQKAYSIRFDLQDKDDSKAYANYESFWIDDEYNNYTIHITGYSGNAGDAMKDHDSCKFTTKDKPNAKYGNENCAERFPGAWWFKSCFTAHLNGLYNDSSVDGIRWHSWGKKSLIFTEMKIRPKDFALNYVTNNMKVVKRDYGGKSYMKKILLA